MPKADNEYRELFYDVGGGQTLPQVNPRTNGRIVEHVPSGKHVEVRELSTAERNGPWGQVEQLLERERRARKEERERRAVVEEHVHVAASHADAEHLAARPLVTSSSALCTCSDGGPSGAEGLASWCACRELRIRVRCASMLRLARLLAVIM